MKATGIVRRIDDLGRVVIPKEIRRTMRIREGDPLEIYTSGSGEVIFKKYSPAREMGEGARLLCEALSKQSELVFLVSDRDHCIAAATGHKDLVDKPVSELLENVMESRRLREFAFADAGEALVGGGAGLVFCVPIIAAGDIAGSVAVLSGGAELTDADRKLAQAAAGFLSRQMEM